MLNQSADPFGIIGQVLDSQFRVDRLVGEGGFSAVYRGHHLGLDEPIAIKCLKLPPSLSQELVEEFERRFRDESRILYRLSQGNLNIVRSIAGGTWQSPIGFVVPYMILEWMEGRSLANEFTIRRTVGKQGRPLDEVLSVFGSAADGLGYAHSQGVIHRDLNPGNFFFTSTPQGQRLKVLDFGVAKILDDSTLNIERNQTVGQIRIFAPAYGAPEQFDDTLGKASAATDVYAFALILLEALRDRPVNDGTHLGEFAMRAVDPIGRPTPRALGIDVPDEVESVFVRATKLKPNERWQSAIEFWAALSEAATSASQQRHQQAALETPPLEMPQQVGRHTQQGMAPPQKGKAPMKRMDKTVPVGAVLPPVPGMPARPPLPPSSPRVPVQPPQHQDVPQAGFAQEEETRIGTTPQDVPRHLPEDLEESDEVTRVGAPAADILRGLADAGAAPVTMTQVSNGNQGNPGPRPAAGHPHQPDPNQANPGYPQQQQPPQQPQRPPQPLAGTLMMGAQLPAGFGPLPPPPQQPQRPPPQGQQMQQPPPQPGYPQAGMPPPQMQPPPPPQQQMPPPQAQQQMPPQQQQPQMQQPPPGYGQAPPQQPQMQQQPPGYGQPQQPSSQQQPAFAQQPGMGEGSLAPQIPKKSSAMLFVGLGVGLIVLLGVGAAVYVVASGPKSVGPAGSASVSATVPATASVPPVVPTESASAEPEIPAVATDDAGAVAEVEVDSGAATNATPPENNGGNNVAVNPGQTQPQNWQPGPGPTPVAVKDAGPPVDPNAFSASGAQQSLANANGVLVFCKKEGGVTGPGSCTVTFNPDGTVATVAMDAPYAGTPTGECVTGQFKRAHTKSFQGSPQSVKHTFEVPK